jgi:hypothetical protein
VSDCLVYRAGAQCRSNARVSHKRLLAPAARGQRVGTPRPVEVTVRVDEAEALFVGLCVSQCFPSGPILRQAARDPLS